MDYWRKKKYTMFMDLGKNLFPIIDQELKYVGTTCGLIFKRSQKGVQNMFMCKKFLHKNCQI